MLKEIDTKVGFAFLVIITIVFASAVMVLGEHFTIPGIEEIVNPLIPEEGTIFSKVDDIEPFSSEEDFKNYLQDSDFGYSYWGIGGGTRMEVSAMDTAEAPTADMGKGEESTPQRVSETNVQVLGIDEPDIVKTDGKEIYFSSSYYNDWIWREEYIYPRMESKTKIIRAFPPESLSEDGEIKEGGTLLLSNDTLVVFSGRDILGYNVSDPSSPQEKWDIELDDDSILVTARLYKNKIYLVTENIINQYHPCPIIPLSVGGEDIEVKCADIYHPVDPISVDVTYNTFILNPDTGKIEKRMSFVGSSASVVYMSENNLYASYYYIGDPVGFFAKFFKEDCLDIIPSWAIDKINKLAEYDISMSSKMNEFQLVLSQYINSLDADEELRIENELTNRFESYYEIHKRELGQTGVVKIGLDSLNILASGRVPGSPLNQFSLDEYQGNLRMAVTVGEGFFGFWGISSSAESANDIYVLDGKLDIIGAVKDLGLTERIYSARFIEDKGYLVTFRQIDPFYVLDLSDPKAPKLEGELKIPGYSSYLHPITGDKILGIGKEDSRVKVSLFDVSDPENPKEKAKYTLDEYWSDVLNTHHAFLLDKDHEIFFLPGSKGGYIFSYTGDKISLKRAVSASSVMRAIYIDDYLYIISRGEIIILNELNWEEINSLDLD